MPVLALGAFGLMVEEEDRADESEWVELLEWVMGIGDRKDEGDLVLESVESLR
jgi:hypothetical protein